MNLNKKGFTLVELLAVIVVLALLMVVATRTIGTSLTKSKVSAMQTEATKVFSKTLEELKTNVLTGSDGYSYGTVTNKILSGTEGDYKFTIEIDTTDPGSIKNVCITDGTHGYSTTFSGDGKISISSSGSTLDFEPNWAELAECS